MIPGTTNIAISHTLQIKNSDMEDFLSEFKKQFKNQEYTSEDLIIEIKTLMKLHGKEAAKELREKLLKSIDEIISKSPDISNKIHSHGFIKRLINLDFDNDLTFSGLEPLKFFTDFALTSSQQVGLNSESLIEKLKDIQTTSSELDNQPLDEEAVNLFMQDFKEKQEFYLKNKWLFEEKFKAFQNINSLTSIKELTKKLLRTLHLIHINQITT